MCLNKFSLLIDNAFYETFTRPALVRSFINFGFYLKENLDYFKDNNNFNSYAIEKLVLIIISLRRHVNERLSDNRHPYGECIINSFDVMLCFIDCISESDGLKINPSLKQLVILILRICQERKFDDNKSFKSKIRHRAYRILKKLVKSKHKRLIC